MYNTSSFWLCAISHVFLISPARIHRNFIFLNAVYNSCKFRNTILAFKSTDKNKYPAVRNVSLKTRVGPRARKGYTAAENSIGKN